MADSRRLVNTGAGRQTFLANTLVIELDPALENVDHLELDFMMMALRLDMLAGYGANHVSDDATVGGVTNTEVAIFEERT